ncbi:MAG: hypothetical protein AB7F75_09955 [Planctomycetota bacterium]
MSFHVWDADAWYYARIGEALIHGDALGATTLYVPPLFGWLLSLLGPWMSPWITVFQSLCLVLASLALWRLGRTMGTASAFPAALMLLFSHALERYGLQGLPDAPFVALHLLLLGELLAETPRLKWIFPLLLLLSLLRFDTLLYMPLYALAPMVLKGRPLMPAWRSVGLASVFVLAILVNWTHVRHGVWMPSPRFSMLYPPVGEDQLLEAGTTLWREMAAEGRSMPAFTSADCDRAEQAGARETENQGVTGLPAVMAWQFMELTASGQLGFVGVLMVLVALAQSPLSRRLALMAAAFTVTYAFLGPRERYLSFSVPLWLLVGSMSLPSLNRWGPMVLIAWVLFQVREGAYHIRHPEAQPLELRMAADWLSNEEAGVVANAGAILSREGSVAYHARRDWWRLPTGTRDEIVQWVNRGGIAYVVADSRFLRSKRPSQTWLLDPDQVPWPCVKTLEYGEGAGQQSVRIYEVPPRVVSVGNR